MINSAFKDPGPTMLPLNWTEFEAMMPPPMQRAYRSRQGVLVITDCTKKADGKMWLHVSFSRKDRLPTYAEMCDVKKIFIGEDKTAYQVFPPSDRHVNIHGHCLHLWHCLDGDPLPEFSEELDGVGRSI